MYVGDEVVCIICKCKLAATSGKARVSTPDGIICIDCYSKERVQKMTNTQIVKEFLASETFKSIPPEWKNGSIEELRAKLNSEFRSVAEAVVVPGNTHIWSYLLMIMKEIRTLDKFTMEKDVYEKVWGQIEYYLKDSNP